MLLANLTGHKPRKILHASRAGLHLVGCFQLDNDWDIQSGSKLLALLSLLPGLAMPML